MGTIPDDPNLTPEENELRRAFRARVAEIRRTAPTGTVNPSLIDRMTSANADPDEARAELEAERSSRRE